MSAARWTRRLELHPQGPRVGRPARSRAGLHDPQPGAVMTTQSWKRPLATGPLLPRAPDRFEGTLRGYLVHLEPALPPVSSALAWHEAVRQHAHRRDTLLLVRSTPGFKQEDESRTRAGRRLRMTDNAPPWWIHAAAFSGRPPPAGGLDSVIDDIWCWMFRARRGSRGFHGHANEAGWYVAHILRAKPDGDGDPATWDDETARRRFLRNMSPLNQFLVPKGNGADIGERPEVIATIASWYRQRFGAAFDRFLDEAGAASGELGIDRWDSTIVAFGVFSAGRPATQGRPPSSEARRGRARPTLDGWGAVLGGKGGSSQARSTVLAQLADADARLARLQSNLTVEQVVGLANALFNKCDPTKL